MVSSLKSRSELDENLGENMEQYCFRSVKSDRRITLGMLADLRPIEIHLDDGLASSTFTSPSSLNISFEFFLKSFFLCFSLIYKSLDNKW